VVREFIIEIETCEICHLTAAMIKVELIACYDVSKVLGSLESSVCVCQSTRRNIIEDLNLRLKHVPVM